MVMDNHRTRLSTINPQSRLFSDTRSSDGGFQSAVDASFFTPAESNTLSGLPKFQHALIKRPRAELGVFGSS